MSILVDKQECAVDGKRRFSLPPRYRPEFPGQTIPSGITHYVALLPWYGGVLAAFPNPRWEEIQQRLLLLDYTTPDFLEAKRHCLPRMQFLHTDPEGRIMLSPDHFAWLRLDAADKGKVMVVGVGHHLEIWNAEEWKEFERTGKILATRSTPEVEYDRKLEVLMRAALEEDRRRGGPGGPGGTGEEAPGTV